MKEKRIKRWGSLLLAAVLLFVTVLSGCGGGSGGSSGVTGRYGETQIADLGERGRVMRAKLTDEGSLLLYHFDYEDGGEEAEDVPVINRKLYSESGALLQSDEITWIAALLEEESYPMTYDESDDGTAYMVYVNAAGDYCLARYKDGEVTNLEMKDWARGADRMAGETVIQNDDEEMEEEMSIGGFGSVTVFDDSQKYPSKFHALNDGFLVLYGGDGVTHYTADGEEVREYDGTVYQMAASGDVFAMEDIMTEEITLHRISTGEQIGSIPSDNTLYNYSITVYEEEIYLASQKGIHKLKSDGSEVIVDGALTSLMLPTYIISDFIVAKDGVYYAVLEEDEGSYLMRYAFDETLATEPTIELNIFSLYDNSTIRQAIGVFQQQNPDVRVNFNVALDEEGSATTEDIIRALNTEMLGGKSPDLIVLDGMPVTSYIEKGVLEDISDLASSGGLMQNLMNTYRVDGKLYGVPSRFTLPIMIGDRETLSAIQSLSDLVSLVEQEQGGDPALLSVPTELWDEYGGILIKYYDACAGGFTNDDGSLDERALTEFFSNILTLDMALKEYAPQMGDEYMEFVVAIGGSSGYELLDTGSWDLRENSARIHLQTLIGMMGLRSIAGDLGDRPDMSLESLFGDYAYYPSGGIGITAAGSQKTLAKQFVETLLSQTVQDKYLYDGFPVNGNSLDLMLEEHLNTEEDPVPDLNFRALSNKLTTPILVDDVVKGVVEELAYDLLTGTVTPEEAAATVIERTRLYLAE